MSSGATFRADIKERREIIVEHLEISMGVCPTAFALQVHPPACRVSFFPDPCITRDVDSPACARPRNFFTFCRRWRSVVHSLAIRKSVTAFHKFHTTPSQLRIDVHAVPLTCQFHFSPALVDGQQNNRVKKWNSILRDVEAYSATFIPPEGLWGTYDNPLKNRVLPRQPARDGSKTMT